MNEKKWCDFLHKKTSYWKPPPLPFKPVLSQKIIEATTPKKYVVDEIAQDAGYSVLRLPPYRWVFNPV